MFWARDMLAGLLQDEIELPLVGIPEEPALPWWSVKMQLRVYQTALSQAAAAGMIEEPAPTVAIFLARYRSACAQLVSWPAATLAEMDFTVSTDFTTPQAARYRYLEWMDSISIQSLRDPNTMRTKGWGFLTFSATPSWEVADKYGPDQAFSSIGSRWYARIQEDQFDGVIPAVRRSALTDEAMHVLRRATGLLPYFVFRKSSADREREFVDMIKLGSTADTARKAAFRVKIPDIIAVDENASSIRQIMGRTSDSSTVCGWYQQLGIAFAPGQEVWSFVFLSTTPVDRHSRF